MEKERKGGREGERGRRSKVDQKHEIYHSPTAINFSTALA